MIRINDFIHVKFHSKNHGAHRETVQIFFYLADIPALFCMCHHPTNFHPVLLNLNLDYIVFSGIIALTKLNESLCRN
jgi:hypothetical protein